MFAFLLERVNLTGGIIWVTSKYLPQIMSELMQKLYFAWLHNEYECNAIVEGHVWKWEGQYHINWNGSMYWACVVRIICYTRVILRCYCWRPTVVWFTSYNCSHLTAMNPVSTLIFKSPQSRVTLCFQFVSAASAAAASAAASAAATTSASHVKTVWA